jgi:hypothetical protein
MASIINKLLGKDEDKTHSHSKDVKCSSCTSATSCEKHDQKQESRTMYGEGVTVKSTVSSDSSSTVSLANQQKLNNLMAQLSKSINVEDFSLISFLFDNFVQVQHILKSMHMLKSKRNKLVKKSKVQLIKF